MANADLTKKLDLSENLNLRNFHIEQLARGAAKLRLVNLSGLKGKYRRTGNSCTFLKTHPDIRKLLLDNCLKFRPTNFIQLKTHLQNLEELSLSRYVPLLCDFTIILHFITLHPKLAYFNLINWQANVRDLTTNFEIMPSYRDITTTVSIKPKDILFPPKLPESEVEEFRADIRSAFEEKKICYYLEE